MEDGPTHQVGLEDSEEGNELLRSHAGPHLTGWGEGSDTPGRPGPRPAERHKALFSCLLLYYPKVKVGHQLNLGLRVKTWDPNHEAPAHAKGLV